MVHFGFHISPADDIAALFAEATLSRALREARSVLVQLFWNASNAHSLDEIRSAVLRHAPDALIVGACADAQIVGGAIVTEGIVASISCFRDASLFPIRLDAISGKEYEAGRALADSLLGYKDLRATLLLAPILNIDAASLVRGLREAAPSLLVFGGGGSTPPLAAAGTADGDAGDAGDASGVLIGGSILADGIVALALCGADLHVEIHALFEWLPLGPAFTLSEVGSGCIRRIDDRPAFELYKKNLNIKDDNDLYLLEFPLLIERDGTTLARNPLSAEADGSVRIVADAFEGESARLGYLDIDSLSVAIRQAVKALRAFSPEGIYLFSCVCRHFTLQEETEMETLPFQTIAPTAGIFTYGEFYRANGSMQLLNSSEVIVALREGPAITLPEGDEDIPTFNACKERHSRITSGIFSYIGALTEKIDAANKVLQEKNDELERANERLEAQIAERKRGEERLKAAAIEKTTLLRELQHRVKNSMALISSLASLEAAKSASAEAKAALGRLRSRVVALGSLYDILYQSGGIGDIQLSSYLESVIDSAAEGLGLETRKIAVTRSIEPLRFDIKSAISIGLIINELVTDSIKYAFPDGRKGTIGVKLFREGHAIILLVEDDGIGLPPGFDPASAKGFGMTLVESLASQLNAEFSARSDGGAKFTLRIPV